MIFTISGFLSGLAGVMWTARYAAAVNETATGFELQTVAACVIGRSEYRRWIGNGGRCHSRWPVHRNHKQCTSGHQPLTVLSDVHPGLYRPSCHAD